MASFNISYYPLHTTHVKYFSICLWHSYKIKIYKIDSELALDYHLSQSSGICDKSLLGEIYGKRLMNNTLQYNIKLLRSSEWRLAVSSITILNVTELACICGRLIYKPSQLFPNVLFIFSNVIFSSDISLLYIHFMHCIKC